MKPDTSPQISPFPLTPGDFFDLLLAIAGVLSLLNLLSLWIWYHPDSLPIGATGGVWTALAYDFSQGIFYRPVFDEFGYGGTRYLFLFFMLHGLLISLFHDPVLTGFSLVLFSAVLLNVGIFALLRKMDLRPIVSAAFSLIMTASISYQLVTLEIMGEFLACALNIWGVVCALHYSQKKSNLVLLFSALCFAGSFLAKFSSLAGLTAVCFYFWTHGQLRLAIRLLIGTGSIILLSLLVAYGLSEGEILTSFIVFGEGPTNWQYALKFPIWFSILMFRDPFFLLIFCFAVFFIFKNRRLFWKSFPNLYFIVSLAFTLFILTSPGTDYNHFLDLIGASVLVLGTHYQSDLTSRKAIGVLSGLLAVGLVFTWLPGTISIKKFMESHGGKPSRKLAEQVIEALGAKNGNILSENPLIPILMNQRPKMLDAFSLRRLSLTRPEIQKDFTQKMESRYFDTVVLLDFSGAPESEMMNAIETHDSLGVDRFYGEVHFPPNFLPLLKKNYSLKSIIRPYVLFSPRKDPVD